LQRTQRPDNKANGYILFSRGKIAFFDMQSVSMIGPFRDALYFTELPFSHFARLGFARCIYFESALTNFLLSAIITQYVFHEMDDET
jgi:hypothetical protein